MAKQEKLSSAVCVNNQDRTVSLEVGKLYQVIPDSNADAHSYIRVIDESGEDYRYSKDRCFPPNIPGTFRDALLKVA